jgi:Concanavalin A-like lectin/glucanases superfamily
MRRTVLLSMLLAALGAAPASADWSLRGYWPMNEGRGQVARDWSGHGNHGQLGSTPGVDANDPSWIRGRFFSGLSFGGDDFVQIPDSPDLEPTEITVSAFFRGAASPGKWRYIVSKGAVNCHAASYGLYSGFKGGLAFYVSDGTGFTLSPVAGVEVWDGRWHHAAGTFDGETVRLYVDGVEVGTGTPATVDLGYDLETTDDAFLGEYGGTCDRLLLGDVDEVSIWSRALPIWRLRGFLQALATYQ